MPHLHPTEPEFGANTAERTVWEALRDQLPDDVALLHSVNLLEERTEREIDLLVIWPDVGIAALEVKGGNVWHNEQGWHQGSAEGPHPMNPVRQIQDARHVLQTKLRRRGIDAGNAYTAHLLAFPHTKIARDFELPDCPRSIIIDRDDLAGIADRVRYAIETHGQGTRSLTETDLQDLWDELAGAMASQVDRLTDVGEELDRLDHLTHDQAATLSWVAGHQRFRVIGGAGSGKTWLALEQARRRARSGERVALLCYSRGLGRFLQRVTQRWKPSERPAYVGLFHDLPLQWGADRGSFDDNEYWERRLPLALGELADARPREELFDSVVVDEGQDFGDLWWPSLLRCLKDPEHGGLFVFMDDGQRVFPRDGRAPIELAPITLTENVRSTKQIAQLCGAVAGIQVTPRGGNGVPVRVVDVPQDRAVESGDDAVEALISGGWEPGSIALLTTNRRHPQQLGEVDLNGYEGYWDSFLAGDDVFYGHVLGFKGLERAAVVLVVNGFKDMARARSILYTGLSRARALLVVVGPQHLVEKIGGDAVRHRLADAEQWAIASD
ncbi:MAG: NERD domain-containing protein [Actinomycetales bacterium]|nr:NERD domain-containing protein [Actinomycetales bacterium]